MNRAALLLTITLAALSSGCFTMNAQLPGTLRSDIETADTEKVGTLRHEQTNYYFIYGLLGAPDEDIYVEPLMSQVRAKGGDGVANLKHEGQIGFLDFVIGYCTLGCVYPRSYTLTGDIVRIKKPPLPGKPVGTKPAAPKAAQATQAPQAY